MRRMFLALPLATAAMILAGVLGSAAADTTTTTTPVTPTTTTPAPTTPPATLTVNGVGTATLKSNASAAAFTAAYRAQLSGALDDAASKAAAIAAHDHLALGAIQSITETSNAPSDGCDDGYAVGMSDAVAAPMVKRTVKTKKAKHATKKAAKKQATAHSASAADDEEDVYPCDVQARVTITYLLG